MAAVGRKLKRTTQAISKPNCITQDSSNPTNTFQDSNKRKVAADGVSS